MCYRVYLLLRSLLYRVLQDLSKLRVANTLNVRGIGCSWATGKRALCRPDKKGDTHIFVYTLLFTEVAYTFI